MLKTLAAKHQSTVSKMAAKHKAKIETRYGLRTCFEARIHRNGKPDLVARFGGIPLVRDKDAVLTDRVPQPAPYPRKELIRRLLTPAVRTVRRTGQGAGPPGPQARQPRADPGQANPRGRRSWRPSDARPSWSAPPATTSSTPHPVTERGIDHWRATCSETGPRGSEEGRTEKELPSGSHLAVRPILFPPSTGSTCGPRTRSLSGVARQGVLDVLDEAL